MEKIIEETGAEKVTVIAYGAGALQVVAGLAELEEAYYADKLTKAVLLAPCFFSAPTGIQFYRDVFLILRENGINTVMGVDK